jgi:hypothetical protein
MRPPHPNKPSKRHSRAHLHASTSQLHKLIIELSAANRLNDPNLLLLPPPRRTAGASVSPSHRRRPPLLHLHLGAPVEKPRPSPPPPQMPESPPTPEPRAGTTDHSPPPPHGSHPPPARLPPRAGPLRRRLRPEPRHRVGESDSPPARFRSSPRFPVVPFLDFVAFLGVRQVADSRARGGALRAGGSGR